MPHVSKAPVDLLEVEVSGVRYSTCVICVNLSPLKEASMESDLQLKRSLNALFKRFDPRTRELPAAELKSIKAHVRRDEALIVPFVDALFKFLKRDNADLRLSVLLLTNHFFQRSHLFRLKIVDNLQDFLLLTLEIDPLHCPLPPPVTAAKELKREALHIVHAWIEKFGAGYATLANAERYLSVSKQFDFENSLTESVAERRREEKERLEAEARAKLLVHKVTTEFEEQSDDIERGLTECWAAIEIVYPKFVELVADRRDVVAAPTTLPSTSRDELNRLHGYGLASAEVNISIPLFSSPDNELVKWSDDNRDLLTSLRDSKTLLWRHTQRVGCWLKRLAPTGDAGCPLTRQLIVLRERIAGELKRCELLKVGGVWGAIDDSDSSDDEDDGWIEVPVVEAEDEAGPSTSRASLTENRMPNAGQTAVAGDSPRRKEIPTISYGLDLKYWGEEKFDHPQRVTHQLDSHPFWRPPDDDYTSGSGPSSSHLTEAYTTRVIAFAGSRPRERRECRARLRKVGKDGRSMLCQRRDSHRCPLHGQIVERDEEGIALNGVDRAADEAREKAEAEREDLALRHDIEAATGCDLGTGRGRVSARAKVARREKTESSKRRDRLKAKLLNSRTMRRVGDAIESSKEAQARERFQHQFNYG